MKTEIFRKISKWTSKEAIVSLMILVLAVFFYANGDHLLGRTFASDNFDLEIGNECSYNGFPCPAVSGVDTSWAQTDLGPSHKFFFFDNVKPGDFGSDLVSLQMIDSDAWGRLVIDNIVDSDNGCNEPEVSAEAGCSPTGDGELRENLDFWVWLDQGQTAGFQGQSDPGEGDNIQNYGELILISKGPVDAFGETWNLADGLSAAYDHFNCASATAPACNGLNADGHLSKDLDYFFGIGWELPLSTGDEVQSDIFGADITFQASEFDFDKTVVILEDKYTTTTWGVIENSRYGELAYNPTGSKFNYVFKSYGLKSNTQYSLIYYADPGPGNHPGAFLGKGTSDGLGNLNLSGNIELNMDLPSLPDNNFAIGAKIWLVPSNSYSESTKSVIVWNMAEFLFDKTNADWINYHDTDFDPVPDPIVQKTISLSNIGATSQYGYFHDYSGANVSFVYDTPANDRLSGMITATGLKPYATYQLKFEGIPTCQDPNGNDTANEYIGYKGRWWDNTTNSNTNDAGYVDNHDTHCITGYLVWDFITADAGGNATKAVETANSYHVLWSGGGTCNSNVNTYLAYLDPAHPTIKFSPANKVDGQIERFACNGLTLDNGNYDLQMTLTEESFHQGPGTWTAVMSGKISFGIY